LKYNPDKIRRVSSELLNALDKLKELANLPKEDFLRDTHKVASAKYHLLVAIEASIDMCNHLISQNRLRTPEDYADTFRVMYEYGMFSEEFLSNLLAMVRFRNRLVHIYWEIDNSLVYQILKEDISDLEAFMKYFTDFLNRSQER
jgi:uncharacterized protein YutE (UPF0331/DUF86 family)